MCWNKEVSIGTFILAMIGSYYLYKRNAPNDRWMAVFGATFGLIQLAEYFMWSDLGCGNMNKYASMFALLVLAAEPLSNMLGGIYFSETPNKQVLKYMLISYIIFIAYTYFTQIHNKTIDWCGTSQCPPVSNPLAGFYITKKCNLEWYFMKNMNPKLMTIWIIFLMIPLLTMTPKMHGMILFTIGFITFLMAKMANTAAHGSLWCWLAVGVIYGKIFFLK